MKRIIGFGMFWMSGGMIINMLLDGQFVQILTATLCLLVGYRLYCFK